MEPVVMKQNGKLDQLLCAVVRGAAATEGSFLWVWTHYTVYFPNSNQQHENLYGNSREDDLIDAGISAVAAALPSVLSVVMRHNVPYALMLVAPDHFHEELSEFLKEYVQTRSRRF
ncbi:hypothetical protein PsorP6_008370 [Peronosclerospora sorghi]|uniref:Uncharacterized protein n=1 Tax=Peronosclerospora sorghi TaxID=230839 RepID=A0ACC0W8H8_9STRA|nr:hypothetical protein PsorP6_008370 [Peronosclerospora sorghi]